MCEYKGTTYTIEGISEPFEKSPFCFDKFK